MPSIPAAVDLTSDIQPTAEMQVSLAPPQSSGLLGVDMPCDASSQFEPFPGPDDDLLVEQALPSDDMSDAALPDTCLSIDPATPVPVDHESGVDHASDDAPDMGSGSVDRPSFYDPDSTDDAFGRHVMRTILASFNLEDVRLLKNDRLNRTSARRYASACTGSDNLAEWLDRASTSLCIDELVSVVFACDNSQSVRSFLKTRFPLLRTCFSDIKGPLPCMDWMISR